MALSSFWPDIPLLHIIEGLLAAATVNDPDERPDMPGFMRALQEWADSAGNYRNVSLGDWSALHLERMLWQIRNVDLANPNRLFERDKSMTRFVEYLAIAGSDVEAFLKSPRWKTNRNGNLVFNSILTIRPTYGGKFGYVIGSGQATFSEEGYKTQEEAQRALWDAMQKIVE